MENALWPLVGLGAAGASAWGLYFELRDLSLEAVGAELGRLSLGQWALAALCSLAAYAALAWYDQIALMHIGRRLPWRFVSLVSFTTYAIGHTIGAPVLSGAVVRYRAYSSQGLAPAEIGLIVAFCSATFTLGALLLSGFTLLARPDFAAAALGAPGAGRLLGLALIAPPALYFAGSLLHLPAARLLGFEWVYPRPPIAARQLLAGPIELLGAAGILYSALPAGTGLDYVGVLAVFLVAFSLALLSHAPGGLGVLEWTFLKLAPEAPRAEVVAALIVFRLLYLIAPFLFSLVIVVLFERERRTALVEARRSP